MNLTSVEPYTGKHHTPGSTSTSQHLGGSGGEARAGGRGSKGGRGGGKAGTKPYKSMTGKEKAELCCRDWNSARGMFCSSIIDSTLIRIPSGCSKTSCRNKHACSKLQPSANANGGVYVCWRTDHTEATHP